MILYKEMPVAWHDGCVGKEEYERAFVALCQLHRGSEHRPACALGSSLDDTPFNEAWSYCSADGLLMYLTSNTFAEVAFTVHP
jgi:hypothetical protein